MPRKVSTLFLGLLTGKGGRSKYFAHHLEHIELVVARRIFWSQIHGRLNGRCFRPIVPGIQPDKFEILAADALGVLTGHLSHGNDLILARRGDVGRLGGHKQSVIVLGGPKPAGS